MEHYHTILNAPGSTASIIAPANFPTIQPKLYQIDEIAAAEVRKAVTTMRSDAAAGPDGIPPRVLKMPELRPALTQFMNSSTSLADKDNSVPSAWRNSLIVSIPKKGNSTALDNQRGISLMCTSAKLLNKVLLNRLLPVINPELLNLQSGFRPGRSTAEQVVALRCIIDDCRTRQISASIVFVDFRKAFDSVSHGQIPRVLALYGVPEELIAAVMDLYQGTTTEVIITHRNMDTFNTSSGVLQGDTLAPFIFIIMLDYVLRHSLSDEDSYELVPRRSRRLAAVPLAALAYADDIALICRDPAAAQRTLARLHEHGLSVGLRISAPKTEVLHIGSKDAAQPLTLPSGETIKACTDFKYLGVQILSAEQLWSERRRLAWVAARKLRPLFNSGAADELKVQLLQACVTPVLLYGLESVPLTPTLQDQLDASYRRLQRYALGVHFPARLSNVDLAERCRTPQLSLVLRKRRLQMVGHALRADTPLAAVLANTPSAARRPGHGRTLTIREDITQDLGLMGFNITDVPHTPKQTYKKHVTLLK